MNRADASKIVSSPRFGALVISLDFELLWGWRDKHPPDGGRYRDNLLGARLAIPRILDAFEEYEISATWATVGFLFARSREEWDHFRPRVVPRYHDSRLFPYDEPLGQGENDDPLHFAPSLIELIQQRPRQELATHTFSHYYCRSAGQDRETFRADLESAVAIAKTYGVAFRSIVLPRNQINPDYAGILLDAGLTSYRGNEPHWAYQPGYRKFAKRAARKLDAYYSLGSSNVTPWDAVRQPSGLCDVASSRFLRPYSARLMPFEPLRLRRITCGLQAAAALPGIYHLWWHPHNFGINTNQNLDLLRRILDAFADCRDRWGMRSLSMAETAEVVLGRESLSTALTTEA